MSEVLTASLLEHFSSLEDPRVERTKLHLLSDILALTICAVICGADSWTEIESYGQAKYDWLKESLALPNGIPSHDTIARLFIRLDPEQLQDCFLSWIEALTQTLAGQVVAIDGKTLRHSFDKSDGKGAIHMVSAWATRNRLVLGQVKVDEKSNEITAIPELLRVLALSGCIVTIDAMGCQKNIAQHIIDKGADYILTLKGNQGHLLEEVQELFDHAQQNAAFTDRRIHFQDMTHDYHRTVHRGHGRVEIRQCWTIEEPSAWAVQRQWPGLRSFVMVEAERRVAGQVSHERRYYLSSLSGNAQQALESIRSHWGIENCLHWVLDMAFREDDSRIREGYADQNLAIVRHIALNLLNGEKTAKVGVKGKRLKAAWDDNYLAKVLAG
jgi:predicted transposase YbfD/YdcC